MEIVVVRISEVQRQGVWHFEPYSEAMTSLMKRLARSPFPVHKLGELVSVKPARGFMVTRDTLGDGDDVERNIPMLSARNLTADGITFDDVVYLRSDEHAKLVSTQLQRGDVVVGTLVRPVMAALYESDAPANISSQLVRLRVNDRVDPAYLVYYLNSDIGQALCRSLATGSVQRLLNPSALVELRVVVPPLLEQRRIAHEAERRRREAAELTRAAARQEAERRRILSDLLPGGDA